MTTGRTGDVEPEIQVSGIAIGSYERAEHQSADADWPTILAVDRTILAAERTYAAWMRTGLAALASGIGARSLLDGLVPGWLIVAAATVLTLFSGFCFVAAVWRESDFGPRLTRVDVKGLPSWLLLGINGFLLLVSLAALTGIWMTGAH